jgi:hypothetical protein
MMMIILTAIQTMAEMMALGQMLGLLPLLLICL